MQRWVVITLFGISLYFSPNISFLFSAHINYMEMWSYLFSPPKMVYLPGKIFLKLLKNLFSKTRIHQIILFFSYNNGIFICLKTCSYCSKIPYEILLNYHGHDFLFGPNLKKRIYMSKHFFVCSVAKQLPIVIVIGFIVGFI